MTQPESNDRNLIPGLDPTSEVPAVVEPALATSPILIASLEQRDSQTKAFDRWLVALVVLTVGAACLLISAASGTKEGMRPWAPNSVLKGLIDLLNLNGAYPTFRGLAVKNLAQYLGAAAMLATAGLAWYFRCRRDHDDLPGQTGAAGPAAVSAGQPLFSWNVQQIVPATAAQIAMLGFAAWAMGSAKWSHYGPGSVNEGLRELMLVIWAVALGRTMTRSGAMRAAIGLVAMLLITAIVGLWYYHERNPVLRLEFPIGGPIFFAACMMPAIILSLASLAALGEHLLGSRRCESGASSDAQDTPADGRSAWVPWAIGAGAVATLVVAGWASVLADSRSPAVALIVALAIAGVILFARHVAVEHRRMLFLGVIAAALLGVLLVGRPWWQSQLNAQEGGRGVSLRLRLHTWQYAQELFFTRPLTGHGQGGYFLLSQQLASLPRDDAGRSDMERDPQVFQAPLVGHAHCEPLEILADLGAVGFALITTALAMTFWAGFRAYLTLTQPTEKWCLLGLMVSLAAILIEECADVALRMPVLPIIFYTIIGLIWAMSLAPHAARYAESKRVSDRLQTGGALGAIVVAVLMSSAGLRDWRAAVADGQFDAAFERQQWDQAIGLAEAGQLNRLVLEDIISASLHRTTAALNAAHRRMQLIVNTLNRQETRPNPARTMQLIGDDIIEFDKYLKICVDAAEYCWALMPCIHSASESASQALLLKAQLESIKQQLGLTPENQPYVAWARDFLIREYQRNRLDGAVALRILELSPSSPMNDRVDLLRIPMRAGPDQSLRQGFEKAVAQLVATERGTFDHQLEVLAKVAQPALEQPDATQWADPYAPETFRLQAMAARCAKQPARAAELTGQAARMYERPHLRMYFPTVRSYALMEQARYLLLADPAHAGKAVEACHKAIDAWPADKHRDEQLRPFRRELSLCLLAAGDEGAASDLMRQEDAKMDNEQLQHNIGYGLSELCSLFMDVPVKDRPEIVGQWLARSLQLAPDFPQTRFLAAGAALEAGHGAEAVEHLKAVASNIQDSRQSAAVVGQLAAVLAARYPGNAELSAYMATLGQSSRPSEDEPAPSSQPASTTAPSLR